MAVPPEKDPLADIALQAQRGEQGAIRQLVLRLAPHLLRVARQVLGAHHPDVHDVAQEAAWGLLKALPRFRRESSIVHFACRVSLHTAMNLRRREAAEDRKLRSLKLSRETLSVGQDSLCPEGEMSRTECIGAVRDLLSRLPAAQAEVLGLHHVVGMTAAEIAELTRTPRETVRSRLKRGRMELRNTMLREPRLVEELEGRRGQA